MSFPFEVFSYIKNNSTEKPDHTNHLIALQNPQVTFCTLSPGDDYPDQKDYKIVWEDQWKHKRAIVKSRILSILGQSKIIYGRETLIREMDKREADLFFEKNHLLGATNSKTRIGLAYNDQIVCAATFSKARKITRRGEVYRSFEMIRFCHLSGITVTGGLSKIIQYFIRKEQPDDLMTYVDKEWSSGESFQKLGFKLIEETPFQYFWVDPTDLKRYREAPLPFTRNFVRVRNSGNYKYILFLK